VGCLALGLGALIFRIVFRDQARETSPDALRTESVPALPSATEEPNAAPPPPPLVEVLPEPDPPTTIPIAPQEGVGEVDRRAAEALAARLRGGATDADVRTAEDLFARYPDQEPLRALLESTLLWAARTAEKQRRFDEAGSFLRRASQIAPTSPRPRLALMRILSLTEDWPGAERAAREVLAIDGRNADALRGLGYALLRQDRNQEAAEILRAALEVQADPATRALLARVEKGLADERGMTEQQLSHFHVRYDGDEHTDVGREILRALERHFATLATRLDHQPRVTIPVILFSRQGYYDANGAPAWSGGNYDNVDGRIRIPIGGLTASLTSDMDETLLHELTHAFIADRTRGVAPREVHEGLAQYMEGKRCETMLDAPQMTALAEGRIQGVAGFYLGALSFIEYLMGNRGQGGMNDLLKALGETANVDESFRRVYGKNYQATTREWKDRLRQLHAR
jgi:hypothetical protein